MGCDIHPYLEYKNLDPEYKDNSWRSFGGCLNPGRQYGIFAKLVGVRNYSEYGIIPLSEPRGLPDKLGSEAEYDNQLYIFDKQMENTCSTENAAKWVANGSSQYVNGPDGKPIWVTRPDWHSHSWVNSKELEEVLSDFKVGATRQNDSAYFAILAAMKELENCGKQARLVFWFDN